MATVVVNRSSTIKDLYNSTSTAGKMQIIAELLAMGTLSDIEIKLLLGIEVTPLEAALYGMDLK